MLVDAARSPAFSAPLVRQHLVRQRGARCLLVCKYRASPPVFLTTVAPRLTHSPRRRHRHPPRFPVTRIYGMTNKTPARGPRPARCSPPFRAGGARAGQWEGEGPPFSRRAPKPVAKGGLGELCLEKRQRLGTKTPPSLPSDSGVGVPPPPFHALWLLGGLCALWGHRLGPGGQCFSGAMGAVFRGAGGRARHHPCTPFLGCPSLPGSPSALWGRVFSGNTPSPHTLCSPCSPAPPPPRS